MNDDEWIHFLIKDVSHIHFNHSNNHSINVMLMNSFLLYKLCITKRVKLQSTSHIDSCVLSLWKCSIFAHSFCTKFIMQISDVLHTDYLHIKLQSCLFVVTKGHFTVTLKGQNWNQLHHHQCVLPVLWLFDMCRFTNSKMLLYKR